ncbi:CDIF630_02480 family spore surface protein [Clostridium sp. LBM24168]
MLGNRKSNKKIPIENHETAAWANIKKTKPVSNVPLGDESNASNAKDWVDENEK